MMMATCDRVAPAHEIRSGLSEAEQFGRGSSKPAPFKNAGYVTQMPRACWSMGGLNLSPAIWETIAATGDHG